MAVSVTAMSQLCYAFCIELSIDMKIHQQIKTLFQEEKKKRCVYNIKCCDQVKTYKVYIYIPCQRFISSRKLLIISLESTAT